MTENKPARRYKNLAEMVASPEYKECGRLIRQGIREGVLEAYPPLPDEEVRRDEELQRPD